MALLLGACATQPVSPLPSDAVASAAQAGERPGAKSAEKRAETPVKPQPGVSAETRPQNPPAKPADQRAEKRPAPAAEAVPTVSLLDATRLPAFEGDEEVLREPLRGLPKIDLTVEADDLWQRIRMGFAMPDLDNDLVREKTADYASRPEYLKRIFDRSRLYLHHIVEELERRGMPTELALLPMVESAFNPMAYSRAHASGLWQFIPPTGKRYALQQNWWFDARRDIVESTAAALGYLSDLYDMHGDWHLALASYNYGENGVARAIERNRAAGLPTDYSSLPMPLETRHYVPKLQALKNIVANPRAYDIVMEPIPNEPYFTTVTKTRDIDVQLAAKLAEMPVEDFIALNPGFSRPIIPVNVNSRLVLPADKVEVFHANLEKYDDRTLVSWKTYRPKPGEGFEAIAHKFKVTVTQLKEVNGITRRNRAMPALLVVPTNGRAASAARLPIMYAPPITSSALRAGYHRVKAGETLYSIARRYGASVENLMRWNRTTGHITVGQTLRIGGPASSGSRSRR